MATKCLSLFGCILGATLVMSASSGAMPPGPSTSARCETVLAIATRSASTIDRDERAGLWDKLRAAREACEGSDIDPRLAARAALVYEILPEYSELKPRVELFESVERSLRALPEVSEELVEILEIKAGTLSSEGRVSESSDAFLEALEVRRELYGAGSAEYAEGLLSLARCHALAAKRSDESRSLALEFADQALALAFQVRSSRVERYEDLRSQVVDVYERVGLQSDEIGERLDSAARLSAD